MLWLILGCSASAQERHFLIWHFLVWPRRVIVTMNKERCALLALLLLSFAFAFCVPIAQAKEGLPGAVLLLDNFCIDCHSEEDPEGNVDLERLASNPDFATNFRAWRQVAGVLDRKKMPPEESEQPSDEQRQLLLTLVRGELGRAAEQFAEDPGPVTLRRLTSAEYAYTIQDLTGVELDFGEDLVGDAVGGEGFANVGDVQFMQDSSLERYLETAKRVARHAVIGAGPLRFYIDPGKTGFELSAIARIQAIYREQGFRTSSEEGGKPFGLHRYPQAFFTAWRFRYREELGLGNRTLSELATAEGLAPRFAEYLWTVVTQEEASFPLSEIVQQWQALAAPEVQQSPRSQKSPQDREGELEKSIRAQCDQIYQSMRDWERRLDRDIGRKNAAPVSAEDALNVALVRPMEINIKWPPGTTSVPLRFQVESIGGESQPVIVWKKLELQFNTPDGPLGDPKPLVELLSAQEIRRLAFGKRRAGRNIDVTDFVTTGVEPMVLELPHPAGATSARLTVEAELDAAHGDDNFVRCTIAPGEKTIRGRPALALLAKPKSETFRTWKAGLVEFNRVLPQASHGEPAPADRGRIPAPFDNSFLNPERDLFHRKIKYYRDDQFLVDHMLDDATREQLDQAWTDLLGSFEYHDAYLRFVANKQHVDLGDQSITKLDRAWVEGLPQGMREVVQDLRQSYHSIQKAFQTAQPGHLEEVIRFAGRAWRRPLSDVEQQQLRSYYRNLLSDEELSHRQAIRVLVARVLVSPQFLYRTERPHAGSDAVLSEIGSQHVPQDGVQVVSLTDWELASRLSYFLWSSLPDAELRRAAAAGELSDPAQISEQTERMLRDPKASRMAAEFFGQWFGFYQFDRFRGVDPERFPEFTDSLKTSMYHEATSFFEHIIRKDRPVREILFSDYTFLNRELASHYGIEGEFSPHNYTLVEKIAGQHRGGLFGLGAVLTVTSAPLRTSPVKRGDWVLRRVLGTPVPPPPANVGTIAADDSFADGLTVRERLDAHRQDPVCMSCHSRIDPLGFALEQYDAIGRWREHYRNGLDIENSGKLWDGSVITGPGGLREYLRVNERSFQRTLCTKLAGYALGRRESISDVLLIEKMQADLRETGRFSNIVQRIVTSPQFGCRRVETE